MSIIDYIRTRSTKIDEIEEPFESKEYKLLLQEQAALAAINDSRNKKPRMRIQF